MAEDRRARFVASLAGSFAQVRDQAVIDWFISCPGNAEKEYGDRVEKAVKALKARKKDDNAVAGRAVRQPCQAHLARSA